MTLVENITHLIGNTPLVRIRKLNPNPDISIFAKLEKFNPGGSVKDRIALYMIDAAERDYTLTKDKTIIEATSGNTGIGLAMVGMMKGYRVHLVMPASMSKERIQIMKSYGAKVTLTPAELGTNGAQDLVASIIREYPQLYFHPNQYNNPANWLAHYETTGKEILEDTQGKVTHFIAGLGTSGTLMGVARALKEEKEGIKIISVEPDSTSLIPGLKNLDIDYVPEILDIDLLDQRMQVSHKDASQMTQDLGQIEGIFSGQSAGAAMWVAMEVAQNAPPESVIVVLFADSGEKYLSSLNQTFEDEKDTISCIS